MRDVAASQLCRLATEAGVDPKQVDAALAGDNPKQCMVDLLLRIGAVGRGGAAFGLEQLRAKGVMELCDIARGAGIDERRIDDAMDATHPKLALIDLVRHVD